MALSKRQLIGTDEGIGQHRRHCTKHHGSKLYVYVVYEANTISRVHALVTIVYQAVHISVTRTDTWQCHLTINLLRARHQRNAPRKACLHSVIKAQTTAKQKRSNPLSKLIDADQNSSQLALHGPTELELITTSAMRTYGSASASCSYVHAFEVCK